MKRLHPEESFTPEIERVLGKGNIIVVKSALGGSLLDVGTKIGNH